MDEINEFFFRKIMVFIYYTIQIHAIYLNEEK